jgi:hypothetical protein
VADINDGTWYTPQWYRTTIFPFSTIGINYGYAWWPASRLSMFFTWTLISIISYTSTQTFPSNRTGKTGITGNIGMTSNGTSGTYGPDSTPLNTTDKAAFGSLMLRSMTLDAERAFWLTWLTVFARQGRAASFYTSSGLSKKMLSSQHPPMLMIFKTHVVFFAVRFLLIVTWIMREQNWMITVATLFFFGPLVRITFQLGVYRYSMEVAHFWSAEDKSPLWIVRLGSLFVALYSIIAIIYGYRREKFWMV